MASRAITMMLVGQAGATIGATAIESLLFSALGTEPLPLLYIAVGLLTIAVTLGAGVVLGRRPAVMGWVLPGTAVAAVVMRGALEAWGEAAYPGLWLAMMVMWTVQGIAQWSVAGASHDTRQAKRLFPIYGGAMIAGVTLGGALTGPLAASLGPRNLVWVWVGALVVASVAARGVGVPVRTPTPVRSHRIGGGARRLLGWMSVAAAMGALLHFVLTFLFVRGAIERYPDAASLASFLGSFVAVANGLALVAAFMVANRLVSRFGTALAVAALTVVYAVGFGALAVGAGFGALLAFRLVQQVWMQGVWGGAWQALYNAVPSDGRDRARTLVDGTALQLGVVASGMLLLIARHRWSPRSLAVVAAVASLGALLAALAVKRRYASAVLDAVRDGWPDVFTPGPGTPVDRVALETLRRAAGNLDPAIRRVAVELLADADLDGMDLVPLINDGDPRVAVAAAGGLAKRGDGRGTEALSRMTRDPDDGIRARALGFLADIEVSTDVLEPRLRDPDRAVRETAARAIAAQDGGDTILLRALDDPRTAEAAIAGLRDVREEGAVALRAFAAREAEAVRADIRQLGLLGDEAGGGLLREALRSAAITRARTAVRALAPVDPLIRPALDALEGEAALRAEATEALDLVRDRSILSGLLQLWDPEPPGRSDPAGAIGAGLAHEDALVRASAAYAARRAGMHGERTRDLAEKDPDPLVRQCAAVAVDGSVPVLERILLLRGVGLFADLSAHDLRALAEAMEERTFADGEELIVAGTTGDELYVLTEGSVRVLLGSGEQVARRGAGEAVGEMSLLDGRERMASVVAEGPVSALVLDRARFRRALRDRPEVGLGVMRVLSGRLREAHGTPSDGG